ncbi:hypothetical protein HMPREF1210_01123 [Paenisporosarcina sp. HGH0030]|uniref:hypothetical protein n=1 Tax=Paenisporosarcina sp. HGH0030 TaxID=1078085 RepID=UPI00034E1BE4|nr:hypothetical protein [Paenisporosarcina sp. HGH0030]EPD52743.1 hypothetical protein HMPREF1210_01123 [Paenisporosarcina sp. HGH0030]
MAETLRQRLVRGYSYSIYIDGMRTFEATNESYHVEIKTYAATNFTEAQIINALAKGWITETESAETLSIKYPNGIPVQEEAPSE